MTNKSEFITSEKKHVIYKNADEYLKWVDQARPNDYAYYKVRLITNSMNSGGGKAVFRNLSRFADKGYEVKIVFSGVWKPTDINEINKHYDKFYGSGKSNDHIRYLNTKRKYREFLDIGTVSAKINSNTTNYSSLDLSFIPVISIEHDSETLFARELAFSAAWSVATPVNIQTTDHVSIFNKLFQSSLFSKKYNLHKSI